MQKKLEKPRYKATDKTDRKTTYYLVKITGY